MADGPCVLSRLSSETTNSKQKHGPPLWLREESGACSPAPTRLGTPLWGSGWGGQRHPEPLPHLPRGRDTEQDTGSQVEDQKSDVGLVRPQRHTGRPRPRSPGRERETRSQPLAKGCPPQDVGMSAPLPSLCLALAQGRLSPRLPCCWEGGGSKLTGWRQLFQRPCRAGDRARRPTPLCAVASEGQEGGLPGREDARDPGGHSRFQTPRLPQSRLQGRLEAAPPSTRAAPTSRDAASAGSFWLTPA